MRQVLYLIAGLGKTGQSIAAYLQHRNLPFIVFDTRAQVPGLDAFKERFSGVDVFTEELPIQVYEQVTEIIASPGIALEEPFLQEALRRGIPVIGDIECLAREISSPVVAITGTNGKSTVTALVGEMAKAAGLSVAVAGNIGLPVLELLDNDCHYDLWVLELSSFQLELVSSLKPVAASILNLSADHLDRHHSMAAYAQAKQRIYKNAGTLIYNREDLQTLPTYASINQISFGLDTPTDQQWGIISQNNTHYLAFARECLLDINELKLKGKHNWQNALAACALATAAGINQEAILTALRSFSGLSHRTQWVRTLDDVQWINDSKGTNIGAALSAINGIGGATAGKIVLIAGGLGKGADFTELRPAVVEYVRSLILLGTDAQKMAEALHDTVPINHVSTLEEAVSLAKALAQPGDVVLLSPACASLDMFRDFNHRGEVFTSAVNRL